MKRDAVLWISGLLTVLLMAGLAYYLRDLKPSLVAAQITFSRAAFEAALSSWSPEQVQRVDRHFAVDHVFLLVYGSFGWLLGRRLTSARQTPRRSTLLLPWLLPTAAALDCTENVLHQAFLSQPNGLGESLYVAAGLAALVKWVLAFVFVVLAMRTWRQNAHPST